MLQSKAKSNDTPTKNTAHNISTPNMLYANEIMWQKIKTQINVS
jgi:hypothetical protein